MSNLVVAILITSMTCSVRREISPCTCEVDTTHINVRCDNVGSFNQVFDALQNRFSADQNIRLAITRSQLDDMETRTFADMNLLLRNLRINYDQLK